MKIPRPTELNPRLAELESKRTSLWSDKAAKVAEAAIVRARIQDQPSHGNMAENRVRAILGEPLLPETAPDMPRLEALLTELNTINVALAKLDGLIQVEQSKASRLVCETARPEVTKRAKAFAEAYLDLHAAHLEYDRFLDEVENTGTNISSLNRVFPSYLGNPRDTCGGYHYSLRDFVEAGIIARSDMPEEIR